VGVYATEVLHSLIITL